MAVVRRQLYVLGGNDLDYNNDRILVRHIDSYDIDMDQWTRCTFSLLTGGWVAHTHMLMHTHARAHTGRQTYIRAHVYTHARTHILDKITVLLFPVTLHPSRP